MTSSDRPSARLRLVAEMESLLGPPLAKCPAPPPSETQRRKTQRENATAELYEHVRETCRYLIQSGQYSQVKLALALGCSDVFLIEVLRQSRPTQAWLIMMLPHEGKVELARRLSQVSASNSETGT